MLLVVLAAGAAACNSRPSAAAAPPSEVKVDVPAVAARVADLEATLQVSGTLAPRTRVAVHPTLPGTLASVTVDIGDRVRARQTVATLDRREIDAQVDAAAAAVSVARAGVESADALLANAVVELERAKNLFEKGAVARQRLDGAETAHRSGSAQRDLARANLAQAEAALRRAREVQRDATLTSPIDGVVVERNFDPGSLVSPGGEKPVVAIADLRAMKLEAGVSELEAGRLRVGMPARVTAQARPNEVFDGRVAAIAPEVSARNRHFAIEIRIENPDATLLSGMYGVASIRVQRAAGSVVVPRDAVTTRGGRRMVLKIAGGAVTATPIAEGLTDGVDVQVLEGLAAGDLVVADARREVGDGVKVNPVQVPRREAARGL
jgi:RND family efflux transporter MFP subunit